MKDFYTLSKVIRQRRSIFPEQFSGEQIDDELIELLLENANWAPNHKHTEPWRFHIYTGVALEQLGCQLAECYKSFIPPEQFRQQKYDKTIKKAQLSSHVILINMHREPGKEKVPEWEDLAAVSCAVQNLWLTTQTLGIGGYWSSPAYLPNVVPALQLPATEQCWGFFYLGIPKKEVKNTSRRKAIIDKITWNR